MCTLTTRHGIKWNIITLNGRVAYQRHNLTVLWLANEQNYVIINALAIPIKRGELQHLLESVHVDLN